MDVEASNDFDVVLGQLVPGGLTAYTGGTVKTKAWSAFADVTYSLTPQLSLSIGGRYTEDKRDADIFRGAYLGTGSPFLGNDNAILLATTSDFEASRTFYNFSPRVNISYLLNDDMTVYAGYSQGWKAGSFDPRGANFATPEVERGFDAEELDSFEFGLKTTWLDGRAITNIAVFYSEYSDMQIPGSVGADSSGDGVNDTFVGTVTNAAQSTISGIEIEGNIMLTRNFSLQFSASLLDASIDEWLVDGVDVSGQRVIQNTPEEMAFIGATYVTPLRNGDLRLNANWAYRGDVNQFELPVAVIDQEAYSLINASVVWTSIDEHWMLGLHGKNLTNEDVRTAGYCFGEGGCPSLLGLENNTTVFYAPPRRWTATVEYRF